MVIKIRLSKLVQSIGARLYGDGDIFITGIASIHSAQSGDITFLKDCRFRHKLSTCAASAVILSEDNLRFCHNIAAIIVENPYLAYVKIARLMFDTNKPVLNTTSGSVIDLDAVLGKEVSIGSNVVIESGVILNDSVQIGSGSFVGKNTKIGIGTCLCANVTVHHDTEIGEYCVIQSGAVIGSDGFGYVKNGGFWLKIPQLGRVKIGNQVEIGACTTIDRGSLDDTQIENGVIIDNQCQIAHNVVIGKHTAVAGGVVIAGSVIIGKRCMIGGASVINGHISICNEVTITGMSMVIKSIKKPGIYSSGIPVQPNAIWRRATVLVMHIRSINKRIKIIEQKLKLFCYSRYFKILGIVYFFILLGWTGFMLFIRFFIRQE